MDYLKLSYGLYVNFWTKDTRNLELLSYMEFLEKLSQALVQDEEALKIVTEAVKEESLNTQTKIQEMKDNLTQINF